MHLNMSFKHFKLLVISSFVLLLSACGSTPQGFVPLVKNVVQEENVKIGVAFISPKDKATTNIYGADCLLCYGVASALTSSLDNHLESTISADDLLVLKTAVIDKYKSIGVDLIDTNLSSPINKMKKFKGENGFAKRDFRPLKEKLGLDMLVVLEITEHGAYRSFSSYIPNGDPQGYVAGSVFTVDLNSNALVQYMTFKELVQPTGEWDEPKDFPNVTTAYYQALENVKYHITNRL